MINILYEDKRILVIDKPCGTVSTELPALLKEQLGLPCVKSVHRLDAATSGLMVFAKSAIAASLLSAQIRGGTFTKTYLALVHGHTAARGRMQDYLYYDKSKRKALVVDGPSKEAQEAILEFETAEEREDTSLVKVKLLTGRTHQIRAQFSSRGYPILGDKKYGIEDGEARLALWSYELTFFHPETNEELHFQLKI